MKYYIMTKKIIIFSNLLEYECAQQSWPMCLIRDIPYTTQNQTANASTQKNMIVISYIFAFSNSSED